MTIHLHRGDLPDGLDLGTVVAVDSETLGLNPLRDRLCVVQLSAGDGDAHLVQFSGDDYDKAKNLKALLADENVLKIFHFARFDVAVFRHWLGVVTTPIYCTKIASKVARTYTDRHGLKDVVREMCGVELSKQQQSSDWAADPLSDAQQAYAASDVLHLHEAREKLDSMLKRENRDALVQACFDFLPVRAALDLAGWGQVDIFAHS
ncbi:ribonuclease H-like domain-containing protein [Parvularcula sp. LCG005]|uniref:ribonuclease D n=1 Tax=Parvularcula sp. LCG005 TaxID=3078805 RepID=UPI0029430A7A|nr:ribonuclease H-like domain-containing protein [Parvularcula sp. LCG005]WOI52901.1 ribonuclease D [Parvularcula sp. LCG005]